MTHEELFLRRAHFAFQAATAPRALHAAGHVTYAQALEAVIEGVRADWRNLWLAIERADPVLAAALWKAMDHAHPVGNSPRLGTPSVDDLEKELVQVLNG